MSFSRIYDYPMREDRYKHMYFPRKRGGGKKPADDNTAEILDKLDEASKMDESLSRSRRTIRDIILCNKFDYFCTFSFNAAKVDRYSYSACKKEITRVFKQYKDDRSSDFRYIIVPELHKDGAIHFHGLVNGLRPGDLTVPDMIWKRDRRNGVLMRVPNTMGYVDWVYYSSKLGYFSCSRIKHYEKCARYVSKYITKDLINMQRGKRIFFCSHDLKRPELILDADDCGRTYFGNPDFVNDFVEIKEASDGYGIFGKGADYSKSAFDLTLERDDGGTLLEEEIFFPRLTGHQLKLAQNRAVVYTGGG